MKLIIDIPEEVYKKAKETHDVMCDSVWLGIKYGTQLQQEPCDDCISRQVVAEVLLKYAHSTEGKAFAEFLVSQINDLPSVTPAEKVGKIVEGGYDCEHFVCSECGQDFGWFSKPNHNYCPNCGAKMVESQERSDKE